MNKKMKNLIDFFEDVEGYRYNKNEIIMDIIGEIESLNGYRPDEIGLERDGEILTTLDDFADEFYEKVINVVRNIIKSFNDDE